MPVLRRPLTAALIATVAVSALAACAPTEPQSSGVQVVASTNVWGDIAQTIGGQSVSVESIVASETQDPHEYAASASDLAKVAGADIVIVNGGGYDEFAEQLTASASGDAIVIDVSTLAPAGIDNEHYWFDLETVEAVAAQLAAAFCELDAEQCEVVRANQSAFETAIGDMQRQLASAGLSGEGVLMSEALPYYVFADAGFRDLTPVELARAVEAGSDIPAVALLEATQLLKRGDVAVLALNAQTASAQTEELAAAATEASVSIIEFSEVLPERTSYLDWMRSYVRAIIEP